MRSRGLAVLMLGALIGAAPATAQFYDLDGAYRCLMVPDAGCEKDLADRPAPAPLVPAPEAKTGDAAFAEVVQHVRDNSAGAKEIEYLARRAEANDPRALEVLAWCRLDGIGGPSDPVAAYWLYDRAAALGVAHARQNQITIYEQRLTAEQRQQVLAAGNKN